MKFDIVEFYPPISEKLLKNALAFANESKKISEQEIKIILNATINQYCTIKKKSG